MQKICADQAALRLIQFGMWRERLFHLCSSRLKDLKQIPVAAGKILEHVAQLLRRGFGIEPKHPVDNVIGAGFIDRIEVSRLSRRLERPDDDPGRVRTQI